MQINYSKKTLQIGPYSRAFGAVVQARAATLSAFRCDVCGAELFFENSVCVTCGSAVGYSREHGTVIAVSENHPIWRRNHLL
jgi:uncharacterized OB-fold protein